MLETVDLYGKHAIIEKKKSRRGGGCHRRPRESPIFGPFQDGSLWTTNKVSSISRDMISQLLADAIPAETLPAGYEGVPKWNDDESISVNKNMASEFKDNLQIYFWACDKNGFTASSSRHHTWLFIGFLKTLQQKQGR